MDVIVPKIKDCRIRLNGIKVILITEGKEYLELPWEAALKIGRAMIAQARRAEEAAKALNIVEDQAIIIRSGFPVGLTNRKDIQTEALKEAKWNRELRKKMPGGIQSQSIVGTPTLIKKPPRRKENGKI